jgi:arsenite methyltransferase
MNVHHLPFVADYRPRVPGWLYHLTLLSVGLVVLSLILRAVLPQFPMGALVSGVIGVHLLIPTAGFVMVIFGMQSVRGRFIAGIARTLPWRGDEHVLDVGCGSGVLLFACAKHLTTGRSTGIDIYDPNAGGGTAELFWKNAHAEGLEEKVALKNMDVRRMTFEDASFDVIVSSFALHHVGNKTERDIALRQIARVLKPGGHIALCDISEMVDSAATTLETLGFQNIQRRGRLFKVVFAQKA